MKVLRIEGLRLGSVNEIISFLGAIDSAYNHLRVFELLEAEAKQGVGEQASRSRRKPRMRALRQPLELILPEDRLRLTRVEIASPGFWEFAGSLKSLEVLRQFLEDRHRRRQDREYRETAEKQRLGLEIEKLRTDVVRDRVEVLRQVGVPDDQLRRAVIRHLVEPLSQIEPYQDRGLAGAAEIVDVPMIVDES